MRNEICQRSRDTSRVDQGASLTKILMTTLSRALIDRSVLPDVFFFFPLPNEVPEAPTISELLFFPCRSSDPTSSRSWRHTKQCLRFLTPLPTPRTDLFLALSLSSPLPPPPGAPRVAIPLILCKHRGLSLREVAPGTQVYVVPVFKQLSRLGGPFFGEADATRVVPRECQ